MKGMKTTHDGNRLPAFGATALVALVVGLGGGVRAGSDRPNRVAIGTINRERAPVVSHGVRPAVSAAPGAIMATTAASSSTATETSMPSSAATATATPTLVSTATVTPTSTATATSAPTSTVANTPTGTATAANTATSTATFVSSATPTATSTSAIDTSTPSATSTRTPTATATASYLPAGTPTPFPTATPRQGNPYILRGGGGCGWCIGLYGDYTSQALVNNAAARNWAFPADAAARELVGHRPYTQDNTLTTCAGLHSQDQCVHDELQAPGYVGGGYLWLSFWTVNGPSGSDTWHDAGFYSGQHAAAQLLHIDGSSHIVPTYVILDPEGDSIPNSVQQWTDFIKGWVDGIGSISSPDPLSPAFYVNQDEYARNNLASMNYQAVKAFIAVGSGQAGQYTDIYNVNPSVSGTNIEGYIGYYGVCHDSNGSATTNDGGSAAADVGHVSGWGGLLDTLQFDHYIGYEDPIGCAA